MLRTQEMQEFAGLIPQPVDRAPMAAAITTS